MITFVTTMWSESDEEDEGLRTAERVWRKKIGSYTSARFENSSASAWSIIDSVVKTVPDVTGRLRMNPCIKLKAVTADDRVILYVAWNYDSGCPLNSM